MEIDDKKEFIKYLERVLPEFQELLKNNKYGGTNPRIYLDSKITIIYDVPPTDIEPWSPGEIESGNENDIKRYYQDFKIEERDNILKEILK